MKIWQRNAVVATVVLFVAVSIYLSWSYNKNAGDGGVPVYQPQTEVSEDGGAETNVSSDAKENPYFSEARMSRQQARDAALTILIAAAERETSTQELKDEANAEIQRLAQQAMKEAAIEGLIKAKGFNECVAYISAEGIQLVIAVPEGGLTAADVTKIRDICMSETQFGVGEIKVMEIT